MHANQFGFQGFVSQPRVAGLSAVAYNIIIFIVIIKTKEVICLTEDKKLFQTTNKFGM